MLIFIAWSVPVLVLSTRVLAIAHWRGDELDWLRYYPYLVGWSYLWALTTLLVIVYTRRNLITRESWPRSVPMHIATGFVISVLHSAIMAIASYAGIAMGMPGWSYGAIYLDILVAETHVNVTVYWLLVAIIHAYEFQRAARERELIANRLQASLTEAQLLALKMQVNPHFLFNALNSVAALIDADPPRAKAMLARLGDFLRKTLRSASVQQTTLAEELAFVEDYLAIERIRFADRLQLRIDVQDALRRALVPHLILQPLVENSIRHGLERSRAGIRLSIAAARIDGRLRLSVANTGPSLVNGAGVAKQDGFGLRSTEERLAANYGSDYELHIADVDGGVETTLMLPLRTGAAVEPA